MKNGWFCVTVIWETGEIQSIWCKSEKLAYAMKEKVLTVEGVKKVYLYREKEVDHERD